MSKQEKVVKQPAGLKDDIYICTCSYQRQGHNPRFCPNRTLIRINPKRLSGKGSAE